MTDTLHYLRSLCPRTTSSLGDGALLRRFRATRDEQAFAELVARHGPLVLSVARRAAGSDADDVFQATFLVLARRAARFEEARCVAGWLVEVARRTALQARAKAARRTRLETAQLRRATSGHESQGASDNLAWLLDTEIARLPVKYRDPVVLCHLQGLSQAEAASRLGWPLGTVSARLARARSTLRRRLVRHGVASSAVMSLLVARPAEGTDVTAGLGRSTVRLALGDSTASSTLHATTPTALAHGVLFTMTLTKLRWSTLAVLALAMLFCGVVSGWSGLTPNSPSLPRTLPSDTATSPTVAEARVVQGDENKDLELLKGTWNVETMEWGGKSLPKELMKGYKFVFAGTKLTWDAAIGMQSTRGKITAIDGTFPCDFKIEPGKQPKEIDITFHPKQGDRIALGIYELKGDALKVCFGSGQTGRRPTEFATKEGVNLGCVTLTRAKKSE